MLKTDDEMSPCVRVAESEPVPLAGVARHPAYNLDESPLAGLYRRKAKDGSAFLTGEEFEAGERLRGDYTRAQLMPRLGIDWDAPVAGASKCRPDMGLNVTEAAVAARMRVEKALDAVGPELSGVLIDICCFLKGLETVERERQWPVRSAKLMLKSGLSALARHYDPRASEEPKRRRHHWGAADYKPVAR